MATPKKKSAGNFVKDIRKNTRRIFTAEQKILIVMKALRAETSVAELCECSCERNSKKVFQLKSSAVLLMS